MGHRTLCLALSALLMASVVPVARAQWSWSGAVVAGPDRGSRDVHLSPDGAGGLVTSHVLLESQVYSPFPAAGALDPAGRFVTWPFVPGVVAMTAIGDAAGGTFVATVEHVAASFALRLHHRLASGADDPAWPAGGVVVGDTTGFGPHALRLASDGAGGAFVAWLDDRAYSAGTVAHDDLYLSRVTAAGTLAAGWPANGRLLRHPVAATNGALVLEAWPAPQGGVLLAMHDLRARLFRRDASGATVAGWPDTGRVVTGVPSYPEWFPGTAPTPGGGALLAWNESPGAPTDARPGRVRALRLAADGSLAAGWPADGVALTSAPDSSGTPQVASDGGDGAYVAWASTLNTGARALRLQHLGASGGVTPGWPPAGADVVDPAGGFHWGPSSSNDTFLGDLAFVLAADAGGGACVAFDEQRPAHVAVRLARYQPGGALVPGSPAEGLLLHDPAAEGHVRAVVASGSDVFVAWRNTPSFPFGTLRVSLVRSGAVVDVPAPTGRPAAPSCALRAPAPNPSSGTFDVRLALPDERPAELALFDMAGRRMRTVAVRGAGEHVVRWDAERPLAPGVYVLALRHGAGTRHVRVAIVR